MYIFTVFINIVAIACWLFLFYKIVGLVFLVKYAKINIQEGRDIISYVVIPNVLLTFFYKTLLILWILFKYDHQVAVFINTLWSIFHIATPIVIVLSINRIIFNLKKYIR